MYLYYATVRHNFAAPYWNISVKMVVEKEQHVKHRAHEEWKDINEQTYKKRRNRKTTSRGERKGDKNIFYDINSVSFTDTFSSANHIFSEVRIPIQ